MKGCLKERPFLFWYNNRTDLRSLTTQLLKQIKGLFS